MKRLFLLSTLLFSGLAFVSCSSDDDSTSDNGGNGDGNTETPVATSITLASDVTTVDLGDTFTFTVMNDLDENVTTTSSFQINEMEATTNNTFTATEAGTYNVTATNGDLTSNTISLTVNDPVSAEPNSVFYNGVNYPINSSTIVLWGGVDPNNTGAVTHIWGSIIGTNGTNADLATLIDDLYGENGDESIDISTYVDTYVEIDFYAELNATLDNFASPNSIIYVGVYNLVNGGTVIVDEANLDETNNVFSINTDLATLLLDENASTFDYDLDSTLDGVSTIIDYNSTFTWDVTARQANEINLDYFTLENITSTPISVKSLK
ncbi:hypothetical protein [Mangrovimonas sp. ST2L15]|uniref:hypothetical protein n=1 Tax=Mangrovimonas sp. ST2L15 TaxID=1645916 RepID=UPI0006B5DFB0|nr:hypothetical protein [Mangrovimonas sp. ST2L15]